MKTNQDELVLFSRLKISPAELSSIFQVTLLQASRNPGKTEIFTFSVDESVRNLTIYITGSNVEFTLIDPSGQRLHIS